MPEIEDNLPLDAQITSTVEGLASEGKDEVMGYAEEAEDEQGLEDESREMDELVAYIKGEFNRSKIKRRSDEERWLECYRNYRGVYGPDVQFTSTEKSRAFIKITKTKVLAAYAQILDILFGTGKFPIGVDPTPIPEGIADSIHYDSEDPENKMKEMAAQGEQGDTEPEVRSNTVARRNIMDLLGPVKKTIEKYGKEDEIKEGPGITPTAMTWEPAKQAARKLEKLMHDQLTETNASKTLRSIVYEMCLFGSGAAKGPFSFRKEYPKWTEDGEYRPVFKNVPEFPAMSIWDAYPDADARTQDEMELFIHRHRMNRSQLRALKKRPMFRPETIELLITDGPNYTAEYWEHHLKDDNDTYGTTDVRRWEVLEFWGVVDKDIAKQAGLEIPEEYEDHDQVQINAWISGNLVLRLVLNPFTPARIPFQIVPYEMNPYSIFGVGIAENMADTQLIMNGVFRLAVDNAVLSSNLVFEVNETNLVPGQDMEVYPGKIFRTQGQLGQAIRDFKFQNVTQECLLMFDKARQLSDEATGMPSYAHGVSGIMSTGRTASGMSMLMGAAKENIKSVVSNVDDYLLQPWGKGLFAFNMQFNFDKDFVGDLDIVARGTESLMRNEIRSQKLLQFYQIASSDPQSAPWVKREYILRELAISLDLDPEKTVNDAREAALQAELIAEMNEAMGIDPTKQAAQAQGANAAAAPSVDDPTQTGGGNVSPGAAPVPGEQGNTAPQP